MTTRRSLNSPMLSMMPRPANSDGQPARVAWIFDLFKHEEFRTPLVLSMVFVGDKI